VLVDESLDVKLAQDQTVDLAVLAPGAVVESCHSKGWLGLLNGSLLDAMGDAGLRVLVTADTHLWSQRQAQLERLGIGVVLVRKPRTARQRHLAIAQLVRDVRAGDQRVSQSRTARGAG